MITVLEVVRHWLPGHGFSYSNIYLIGGGTRSGSKIRFLGVTPNETDPVKSAKIEHGCPDITDRDARAFVGIDPRFDTVLARLIEEQGEEE